MSRDCFCAFWPGVVFSPTGPFFADAWLRNQVRELCGERPFHTTATHEWRVEDAMSGAPPPFPQRYSVDRARMVCDMLSVVVEPVPPEVVAALPPESFRPHLAEAGGGAGGMGAGNTFPAEAAVSAGAGASDCISMPSYWRLRDRPQWGAFPGLRDFLVARHKGATPEGGGVDGEALYNLIDTGGTSALLELRRITDASHPLHKVTTGSIAGGFATAPIAKDDLLGFYPGILVSVPALETFLNGLPYTTARAAWSYDIELNAHTTFHGAGVRNVLCSLNDFHGIETAPSAGPSVRKIPVRLGGFLPLVVFAARRAIPPGAELTLSYGSSWIKMFIAHHPSARTIFETGAMWKAGAVQEKAKRGSGMLPASKRKKRQQLLRDPAIALEAEVLDVRVNDVLGALPIPAPNLALEDLGVLNDLAVNGSGAGSRAEIAGPDCSAVAAAFSSLPLDEAPVCPPSPHSLASVQPAPPHHDPTPYLQLPVVVGIGERLLERRRASPDLALGGVGDGLRGDAGSAESFWGEGTFYPSAAALNEGCVLSDPRVCGAGGALSCPQFKQHKRQPDDAFVGAGADALIAAAVNLSVDGRHTLIATRHRVWEEAGPEANAVAFNMLRGPKIQAPPLALVSLTAATVPPPPPVPRVKPSWAYVGGADEEADAEWAVTGDGTNPAFSAQPSDAALAWALQAPLFARTRHGMQAALGGSALPASAEEARVAAEKAAALLAERAQSRRQEAGVRQRSGGGGGGHKKRVRQQPCAKEGGGEGARPKPQQLAGDNARGQSSSVWGKSWEYVPTKEDPPEEVAYVNMAIKLVPQDIRILLDGQSHAEKHAALMSWEKRKG